MWSELQTHTSTLQLYAFKSCIVVCVGLFYPISCLFQTHSHNRITLTALVESSCSCWNKSNITRLWILMYLRMKRGKKQHHHEVMYPGLICCRTKFLFTPLWWKAETGSVLNRQIHAHTHTCGEKEKNNQQCPLFCCLIPTVVNMKVLAATTICFTTRQQQMDMLLFIVICIYYEILLIKCYSFNSTWKKIRSLI